MGIAEISLYALECDACPERWPPLPQKGIWESSGAAADFGMSQGWCADNFRTLCPACHRAWVEACNEGNQDDADELAAHAERGGHDV